MAGSVMEVWAVKQLGALDTDMGRIIKITLYFIETVDSGHSLATKVAQGPAHGLEAGVGTPWDRAGRGPRVENGRRGPVPGVREGQWGVIWLARPQQLLLLARDKGQSGCLGRGCG